MFTLSLTKAAKAFGVPQHKLIHLCEKKVVVPDLQDASGRGSRRQFSKRNLFDFAVALEMRRLELPVSFVRAVLKVLRSFETEVQSAQRDFVLPESLVPDSSPRITLIILDGEKLYFTVTENENPRLVLGGVDVRYPRARGRARNHKSIGRPQQVAAREAFRVARTRTEVDLSKIARDLEGRLSDS